MSCTFGRCGLAVLKCELENQNFQSRDSDSFPNEWRVYCEISKPNCITEFVHRLQGFSCRTEMVAGTSLPGGVGVVTPPPIIQTLVKVGMVKMELVSAQSWSKWN